MTDVQKMGNVDLFPWNFGPSASEPDDTTILEHLQDYKASRIGNSYFYIQAGDTGPSLCRIVHGGGKIFFHEVVDHHKQGVSAKELEEAMGLDTDSFTLPGYYPVSHAIEMKLRSHSDS